MSATTMSLGQFFTPSLRVAPLVVGALALIAILIVGRILINAGSSREISQLQIEGELKHVSAHMIDAAVRGRLALGLVAIDLDDVKANAENLPWVARARVERIWPTGVRVRIWERQPYARWGETRLLDAEARVFTPVSDEIEKQLPLLIGPKGRERDVMETYQRLSRKLAGSPFELSGLSLDARGEWAAQTQSGIGLHLGRSTPDEKLDFLRGPVTQALTERMGEVNYVDLRYTNGFAVSWKEKSTAALGGTHG